MTKDGTHAPPAGAIRGFLRARFAGQSGWLCLGWIAGDPRVEPLRETWFELPRQFTAAVQCAETLAACQYNLYVAPCLFSERARRYATALPSAWLWLDDVALHGAELVESSPDNYQSWLPLDQPLDARERSILQRALRNANAGADACSADAVHMARLPGGWNRKRHERWHVRVARAAGPPACVDDLRARFPCTRPSTQHNGFAGEWTSLPKGEALAGSPRFLALVQANTQLGQLIADAPVGLDCRGSRDTSRSARRAIFVCQLLRARYPHDEIRALAAHFADLLDSGRGDAIFRRDVDRLLAKYTPANYAPEATRAAAHADDRARPRGGRALALTAEALLDFYHQYADCGQRGIVLEWTRAEVARRLCVSTKTIERREGELIAAGTIRRKVSGDCQRSSVILSPATWDVDAHGAEMPSRRDLAAPTWDVATERAAMPSPQAWPCAADREAACQDAASAPGIPATLPPTPAQAPGTDAEETHHPAAEGHGAAERHTPDTPTGGHPTPTIPAAPAPWGGVCLPRQLVCMIIRRIALRPHARTARPCETLPSRAPPGPSDRRDRDTIQSPCARSDVHRTAPRHHRLDRVRRPP